MTGSTRVRVLRVKSDGDRTIRGRSRRRRALNTRGIINVRFERGENHGRPFGGGTCTGK